MIINIITNLSSNNIIPAADMVLPIITVICANAAKPDKAENARRRLSSSKSGGLTYKPIVIVRIRAA